MSKKNFDDDIAFHNDGEIFMVGEEVAKNNERIVFDPNTKPILAVGKLDDEIGMVVFGPPSEELCDLLDYLAATYRKAVNASKLRTN